MIQARRWISWGLILILALMPFHAFFSVWLGHQFGHQQLWQGWKEVVSLLLVILAAILVWRDPQARSKLSRPPVIAITAFLLVALVTTAFEHPNLRAIILGFKTDFEYLILLLIAYLAATRKLESALTKVLIATSGLVIAFGLLQIFALPRDILQHVGYGPSTIEPFLIVAGQQDLIRIVSTLGGPNQLGAFLILPLCLVTAMMIKRLRWWHLPYLLAGLIVEIHTYSRSAWLGLVVALAITVALNLPRKIRAASFIGAIMVLGAVIAGLLLTASHNNRLQYYLLHGLSSDQQSLDSTELHDQALRQGLHTIEVSPLGLGLGSAGPASFQSASPEIPENYYLQIGIEAGIIGLAAFLAVLVVISLELLTTPSVQSSALLGALAGLAVVNLFLHGLADSSTSISLGIMTGATLGASEKKSR
jgi:O-antigen ligase